MTAPDRPQGGAGPGGPATDSEPPGTGARADEPTPRRRARPPASWRLGLLGHPIAHSRSPALHGAALRSAGLVGSYDLFDVSSEQLTQPVAALRRGELHGLNVTVPHKQAIVTLCDRTVAEASLLGAVNTLTRSTDGHIVGHNTDVLGLAAAVAATWPGRSWRGATVCVIGAGGAARAAVLAAGRLGASRVQIFNRTADRAKQVAADLHGVAALVEATGELGDACAGADLVLQATSLGMGAAPGDAAWQDVQRIAVPAFRGLAGDAALMDLIYAPPKTAWIAAAEQLGVGAAGGLEMLIRQAAAAFELWTSVPADVAAMRRACA